MIFEQIKIGSDRNFAYLFGDEETGIGAVVDPAYRQKLIFEKIEAHSLTIKYILCTHSDFDHIGGNDIVKEKTNATVIAHESIMAGIADQLVVDNEEITVGNLNVKLIHTPGHTYDSMCILVDNKLITGDTLFVGKIGGTSNRQAAEQQYRSLHEKLMTLPEHLEVYPGHDFGVTPSSTIGEEKSNNPFILQRSFEQFLHLKEHWVEYKAKHGIK